VFKREDWIFGSISLVLGIAVLLYSRTFDVVTSMDPSGPAAMPRIVAWLMVFIGAIHVAGAYRIVRKNPVPEQKQKKGRVLPVVLLCAACGVYYLLLDAVGYLLMTPLLIIAIMTSVGERNVKRILGASIGMSVVLFCVFQYLLKVNMPMGILTGLLG
jgi:putative tricarboxylic transport membrane protein